jgi:two-component system phosphate regulon response regulator PhoB/two-component system alkaline phosphatase synthesis response regulator PhoP
VTTTEFKLLRILAERRGWVFSRDEILNRLWGEEKAVLDRTIDVHVTNLRKKLGRAGRLIENVRGVGYKLSE